MTDVFSGRPLTRDCDVVVAGSGAAAFTAAITAKAKGLDVVMVEKSHQFGGTSAISGGVLWAPGYRHSDFNGPTDTRDRAKTYLAHELGNHFDDRLVSAYLDRCPEMLELLEGFPTIAFEPVGLPDYHPDSPGGAMGHRPIRILPFSGSELGLAFKHLRWPIGETMLWGRVTISSDDLRHVFRAHRSLTSLMRVARVAGKGALDCLVHPRGTRLAGGNALISRLARTAADLGVPLHLSLPLKDLKAEGGRVTGPWLAIVLRRSGSERASFSQPAASRPIGR